MLKWIWQNQHQGEVSAHINGQYHIMKLSLAAIAQIETCYNNDILKIIDDFEKYGMKSNDIDNIIRAGLSGAHNKIAHNPKPLNITGGQNKAKIIAQKLIKQAFNTT